jgi:membrane-associated phospholipid phosphatase
MIGSLVLAVALSQAAPQKLAWDPRVDIPVTAALGAGWLLSEFAFKKDLAVSPCLWCETNGFDTAVRSAFNPSLMPSADGFQGAHVASNLVGFIALPVGMLGLDALLSWRDGVFMEAFWVDALLILEATLSIQVVNQVVKFAVARGRPYTVGASAEQLASAHDPNDHTLSFFSGHATMAFGLVGSAATIASLRGYRHAWLLWAVGLPLASTTALLRLAADKHWMTDVLLGSALGLATGILMPTLLHRRIGPIEARVTPMPNGLALAGRF